jgi:hypothetical protein
MFTQTWKKYLPVIAILIKRSTVSEQVLCMNHTDFERAAGGRKIKYSFGGLLINKSRINNEAKQNAVAKELGALLKEDESTRYLISDQNLEFALNNVFKLTIKNNTETVTGEITEAGLLTDELELTPDTPVL